MNSLANYTNCVANYETYTILKALNAAGPDISEHGCKVQDYDPHNYAMIEGMDVLGMQGQLQSQPYTKLLNWPDGTVFDKLVDTDKKIDLILDGLKIAAHPHNNGAGSKKSKKAKTAKLEKDEDTLFTRRLRQDEIKEGFEQIDDKVGQLEATVGQLEAKMDAKVGQLEAKVGQLEEKIDTMMKMMVELVLQNHVQNEVEN